jgi:hypothetical protein
MNGRDESRRTLPVGPAEEFRELMEREQIEAQDPEYLLAQGEHLGFAWVVAHNGRGFRCGYVRLPPGHPWHGLEPCDIDARVHGSVNWAQRSHDGGWWIGFDANHAWDLADPDLPVDPIVAAFNDQTARIHARHPVPFMTAAVRGQAYMEDQCRCLCGQAGASAASAGGFDP